jgi:ArsR family transcriptional regulator, arsenate/arsenite/antimonite-responsive transcriptional repressor / arsenate reductase (thioredoxin)
MPPAFIRLAGHDLRWRLLKELAQSDRRVRELVNALDEPQNLISYHLGMLRHAGLVTTRRSNADRRDIYYHLDLGRCAEFLAGAATSLHPGLAHQPASVASVRPVSVLFLCTGNSARSPIAAALLRHRAAGVETASAGSNPKPLHPYAVRAGREYGIDIGDHEPRHVDEFVNTRFDYVISLCDRVREVCPEFPRQQELIHWSIPNPSDDGRYTAFRRTAAELDERIRFFVPVLAAAA